MHICMTTLQTFLLETYDLKCFDRQEHFMHIGIKETCSVTCFNRFFSG